MKRRINTSTLLGNWKKQWNNCKLCSWHSHQRINKGTGGAWKLEDERRLSKLLHYWDRLEYWKKSWKLKETCCHSNSCERPLTNADEKNSQGIIIIIIIIIIMITIIIKNVKRRISTSTLLKNWKKLWMWRLYQLWLVLLAQ